MFILLDQMKRLEDRMEHMIEVQDRQERWIMFQHLYMSTHHSFPYHSLQYALRKFPRHVIEPLVNAEFSSEEQREIARYYVFDYDVDSGVSFAIDACRRYGCIISDPVVEALQSRTVATRIWSRIPISEIRKLTYD